MNVEAIKEFTAALSEVCRERGGELNCLRCCYRVFCYTPPNGWTNELIETVIRLIDNRHLEKDLISPIRMKE